MAEDIVLVIVEVGVYLHVSFIAGTHTPNRKIITDVLIAWAGKAWEIIYYGFHYLDFKLFSSWMYFIIYWDPKL